MYNLHDTKQNKTIQPDNITYTTVIHGLVKGNYQNFSKKSQKLLNEMYHLYQFGN